MTKGNGVTKGNLGNLNGVAPARHKSSTINKSRTRLSEEFSDPLLAIGANTSQNGFGVQSGGSNQCLGRLGDTSGGLAL